MLDAVKDAMAIALISAMVGSARRWVCAVKAEDQKEKVIATK